MKQRRQTQLTKEVLNPTKWLKNIKRKNSKRKISWVINKEAVYDNYTKFRKRYDKEGNEKRIEIGGKGYVKNHKFHSMIMILPDGKIITPIRQFCDLKLLREDQKEAYFFNFSDVNLVTEDKPPKPKLTKRTVKLDKEATRGTMIAIKYPVEKHHKDLVLSMNRSFSLESINDENRAVLDLCMNKHDMSGHWINHQGLHITIDDGIVSRGWLSFKAVIKAIQIIADEGLDTSDLVLATSAKGIRDLTLDKDLDKMIDRYNDNHDEWEQMEERPFIISQPIIEKILGIKMFVANATRYGDLITRSVLFMPNLSFGLVSGEELKLEGKKKLRPKVVHVTGTERVTALLKSPESVVRISHD